MLKAFYTQQQQLEHEKLQESKMHGGCVRFNIDNVTQPMSRESKRRHTCVRCGVRQ